VLDRPALVLDGPAGAARRCAPLARVRAFAAPLGRSFVRALMWAALLGVAPHTLAQDLSEYRLKAAFLYNFAVFTEWPAEVGSTLTLCVHGPNPFGKDIEGLHGKAVGARRIAVQLDIGADALDQCEILFITAGAITSLPRVLEKLRQKPVLTVADSPGAARQGVALNMGLAQNKITFEANLKAAQAAKLNLSSKLLRLAVEVHQ
jgi:YfiR/HmsC-like